ncbi:FAD/NAD(P)-binding domain-containing protein [Cadophora sp. DSE1049]|nr:FAD/NAD(P)-binding domain-containing protein [Cadophora sp. DSE1049]
MSSPRILIAGGGIGGLALAQGLKKHNIPFTVFETDSCPNARAQGYRIRIAGNGAVALHECLSVEHWNLFERTCANVEPGLAKLNALDATNLSGSGMPAGLKSDPNVKPVYAVDRKTLRSLLTMGLEDHIKYGKSFVRYQTTEKGIKAIFSDGSIEEGTLLVGAEDCRYVDTGTRCLYGKTPMTDHFVAQFSSKAMKGMGVIKDKNNPVGDYVYWVFGGNVENIGLGDSQFHGLSGKAAADLAVELTKDWDPSIKCLFEQQDFSQCAPLRLMSARPVRPDWKSSASVTLLGDAAHAIMPAGGSGANTALADAALLLEHIVQEGVSETVLSKYVDEMWKYALPAIEGSVAGAEKLLGFKGFKGAREIDFC